jgi:TPR repeat protein
MNVPEFHLRASARDINRMSTTDLDYALRQLKERRGSRSQWEELQQEDPCSLELEQAAYQLAGEAEAKGDLVHAARWYTAAAINDFADASLRLAKTLDALADEHLRLRADNQVAPDERYVAALITEACRWYSEAHAAGETEAEDLLDRLTYRIDLIRRCSIRSESAGPGPRPKLRPLPDGTAAPEPHPASDSPHDARFVRTDEPCEPCERQGAAGLPKSH